MSNIIIIVSLKLKSYLIKKCLKKIFDINIQIQLMKKKVQKDKDIKKINFEQIILKNLSEPRQTLDYTGYQFTKLNLGNKSLEILSPIFKEYKYVEHIDLSNNLLVDLSHLALLPNLISLNAEKNNVKDFKFLNVEEGWKNLRTLNLAFNKIVQLVPFNAPALSSINLIQNKIEKIQTFTGHPKLKKFDLRRNKIGSLQGLSNMPQLKQLYLAQNKVKSLVGLEGIPNLSILHLRKNIIVAFEQTFPNFQNLAYLNLRENLIEKIEEIHKTKDLANLRQLIFSQNPLITKNQFYLFDVINVNLKLKRVNKISITKSIKLRAFKHAEEKWNAEVARKKAEQQQKLRLQAAEKPAQQS